MLSLVYVCFAITSGNSSYLRTRSTTGSSKISFLTFPWPTPFRSSWVAKTCMGEEGIRWGNKKKKICTDPWKYQNYVPYPLYIIIFPDNTLTLMMSCFRRCELLDGLLFLIPCEYGISSYYSVFKSAYHNYDIWFETHS